MKKFFLAALLLSGTAITLFSCNNGAYDMDPDVTNPALNPLDPNSGVTIYLGTMKAHLNGTATEFYPAYYTNPGDKSYFFYGTRGKDKYPAHTIIMGIGSFENIKEFNASFTYRLKDTVIADTLTVIEYGTGGGDNVAIEITGNEDNNFRGKFNGKVHRIKPSENKQDVIEIVDGEFYLPKREIQK